MKKLFLSIIALALGIGAWAETQNVSYIDANGQQQTVTATVITNETGTLNAGWYVVLGSDVQTGTLTCNGDVHLILADCAKLTAQGRENQAGITVTGYGNSLTIYGQSAQSGQFIANGEKSGAGIGGGNQGSGSNITINGGVVTATGGQYGAGIGGGNIGSGSNITINGGVVTAAGGQYGAGIGGGKSGSGSNITINGGTVTANGGEDGAGIGGGCSDSASDITINGGTVTATGSIGGAGIGGGRGYSGSNITINGGVVTAAGGMYGTGIGGGMYGSGVDITINGGTVEATGGVDVASIGKGYSGNYTAHYASDIMVSADCHVFAGDDSATTNEIQHNSDTDLASDLNVHYAFIEIDQNILSELRAEAITAIDEAVEEVANAEIIAIAETAKNSIMNATGRVVITNIKDAALAELQMPIKYYNSGKADAFGPLGTPQPGPAVKVTKGDTEVILYLPDKVEYIIRK